MKQATVEPGGGGGGGGGAGLRPLHSRYFIHPELGSRGCTLHQGVEWSRAQGAPPNS